MSFKRRHYEELAAALAKAQRDIRDKEPQASHADMLDGVKLAAERVADVLARINPGFNRERFLNDCEEGS